MQSCSKVLKSKISKPAISKLSFKFCVGGIQTTTNYAYDSYGISPTDIVIYDDSPRIPMKKDLGISVDKARLTTATSQLKSLSNIALQIAPNA